MRDPKKGKNSRSPVRKPTCNHFAKTKTCPFGDRCKFDHANPAAPGVSTEQPQVNSPGNARSSNSPAPGADFP